MEFLELIIRALLQLLGMVAWLHLTLLLMQVVICNDARFLDLKKLKAISFKRRCKIFFRHIKNDTRYRGLVLLFIASVIASNVMMNEMYLGKFISKNSFWLLFHPTISIGIHKVLNSMGYTIKLFDKIFNRNGNSKPQTNKRSL